MVTEHERKSQMVSKINDDIVKNGFKSLTMDGISKIMGISRGKLYQYFSSKDEVIEAVVARYTYFIVEKSEIRIPSHPQEFIDDFVSIFFQNMILAGSASDIFVNELREVYPALYQEFSESLTKRNTAIQAFYESGMANRVFNPGMNAQLLQLQDQTMLPVLVNPKFLFTHQFIPAQIMRDYLKLRILEVIIPEHQHLVNQVNVEAQINHLDEKYRRVLWDNL